MTKKSLNEGKFKKVVCSSTFYFKINLDGELRAPCKFLIIAGHSAMDKALAHHAARVQTRTQPKILVLLSSQVTLQCALSLSQCLSLSAPE